MLHLKIFILLLLADMMSVGLGDGEKTMSIPSIADYFPGLRGDLTRVQWAHAVNSLFLLEKALSDKNVMMLEADVVLGRLEHGQDEIIPIMAHPPKNSSDLSLHMFIQAVINAQKDKRKGIKLDFKSTESFQESCKIIDSFTNKLSFPLLLNADILPGPVNSTVKPVNSTIFLNMSSHKFPNSTLSLGWTTKFGPGMEGIYTEKHLQSMKVAIQQNKVKQPVTLCLRAGIAANSFGIKDLVEGIDEYQRSKSTSVTIWMSSENDPVDISKLRDLILRLNRSRVLLDVPKNIHDELALDTNSARTPITAAQGALVALLTSVSAIFSNMF